MMKIKTFLAILITFLALSACAKKTAREEPPVLDRFSECA